MKSRIVRTSFPLILALAMVALLPQMCCGQDESLTPAPKPTEAGAQPLELRGKEQLIQVQRAKKRSHWYHLRGEKLYVTRPEHGGFVTIHGEEAFKKYKKVLKEKGTILKDVRPYEEAHPICHKVQQGSQRWLPVAQFSSQFLVPAAVAGAGVAAKGENKTVVVGQ